jgi:predicted nucleic acid-binding protein
VRILLLTNVLVRTAISPDGPARKILERIRRNHEHGPVVSYHILSEVADVLRRSRIRARWPLSDDHIQRYCQFLPAAGEIASRRKGGLVVNDEAHRRCHPRRLPEKLVGEDRKKP